MKFMTITSVTAIMDTVLMNTGSELQKSGSWFLMQAIHIKPKSAAGDCSMFVDGGGPKLGIVKQF